MIDFNPDNLSEVLRENLEILFQEKVSLLAQKELLQNNQWYTSCIPLIGQNKYFALVECTEPLIKDISLFMFDRKTPAPSRAETIDSIAECANIVGGLIKSELKTHYAMGLPLAFASDGSFLKILYSDKIAEFCYVCFNAPMKITIYGSV